MQASLFNMAATLIRIGGAPVSAWLMAHHLTQSQQGYYYTFASLLSVQYVLEMGIGPRLVQFLSHEWALLSQPDSEAAAGRFHALVALTRRYYLYAGLTLVSCLFVMGYLSFAAKGADWAWPWTILLVAVGFRFLWLQRAVVLEGTGNMRQVYQIRAGEATLMTLTSWAALLSDRGLWVQPCIFIVASVYTGTALKVAYGRLRKSFPAPPPAPQEFPWRLELWPLYWRQALGMAVGVFCSMFPLILFNTRGPGEAGQFGLTWALASALVVALPDAYMSSFWSPYGARVAQQDYSALYKLHRRCRFRALSIGLTGSLAILALLCLAPTYIPKISQRLLPPSVTIVLLLGMLLQQASAIEIQFVRSFKVEPFLAWSLLCSGLIGVCSWTLSPRYGSMAIAVTYLLVHLVVALPVTHYMAHQQRQRQDRC